MRERDKWEGEWKKGMEGESHLMTTLQYKIITWVLHVDFVQDKGYKIEVGEREREREIATLHETKRN